MVDPITRYANRPEQLRPGNQLRLLHSGSEAFPAMLAAIHGAERSICLETYILYEDHTGRAFAAALAERARAGVAVRLMYDAVGGLGLSRAYVRGLIDSGVEVLVYHPLVPWKPRFNFNVRDHRKILVVDHRVAFAGGVNLSDDYVRESEGGAGWYDKHCEVRGPLVDDLERLFRRVWVREGGKPFFIPKDGDSADGDSARAPETPAAEGDKARRYLARVIANRQLRHRSKIRRAYLHAINRARARICIMNAYFMPDSGIRRALRRAARRGVEVSVVVPERSDIPITLYAGQYLWKTLLNAGVRLLVWPSRMMHAKTAVIDASWSAIGSYNLDNRSLRYNLEVLIEVVDRDFGALMEAQFDSDTAVCTSMTLEEWQKRPWWKKFVSWFFYRFHRWM